MTLFCFPSLRSGVGQIKFGWLSIHRKYTVGIQEELKTYFCLLLLCYYSKNKPYFCHSIMTQGLHIWNLKKAEGKKVIHKPSLGERTSVGIFFFFNLFWFFFSLLYLHEIVLYSILNPPVFIMYFQLLLYTFVCRFKGCIALSLCSIILLSIFW